MDNNSETTPTPTATQTQTHTSLTMDNNSETTPMATEPPTLQIEYSWSGFQNRISTKTSTGLQPLYIQHFRPTKPQLRFNSAADDTPFATGTLPGVRIAGLCVIHGKEIPIKPLSRWKTAYGYHSHVLSTTQEPVAISWVANSTMKTWDFVCLDEAQMPLAKFSVNVWAMKQIGNLYFEKPVPDAVRDEIVVTGLTVLYVMTSRMSNPLHILGAAITKPGLGAKEDPKDV